MSQLLVKDAPFNFSQECKDAFDLLKKEGAHASPNHGYTQLGVTFRDHSNLYTMLAKL